MAPEVGLEPTTLRLTAECSAIELLRIVLQQQLRARKPRKLPPVCYSKCTLAGQSILAAYGNSSTAMPYALNDPEFLTSHAPTAAE